jgi:YaiO family outer membrane protein
MKTQAQFLILSGVGLWLGFSCCEAVARDAQSAYQVSKATDNERDIRLLRSHLAGHPDDIPARARLARLLGQAGMHEEALSEYEGLIQDFPIDVDYSLGRAQVLSWLGRTGDALEEIERARHLAPDYEAVWQLQFSILQHQQTADSERTLAALIPEAQRRFPEGRWHQSRPRRGQVRWEMTLGASHEELSDDLQNWNSQFAHIDWLQSANARYYGHLARDERFDLSDTGIAIGSEWKTGTEWTWGVELNASPGADFQPESGFASRLERGLGNAWLADASVRQRRYSNATVTTYGTGLQKYFGSYRAAYGLNLSHLHGSGNTVAHSLALDWYINPENRMRVTVAAGEEAEAVAPGQVLETSVSSLTLSGRHEFNERLAISWWAGTHRQGDLYRRTYAGLAFTVGL